MIDYSYAGLPWKRSASRTERFFLNVQFGEKRVRKLEVVAKPWAEKDCDP